MAEDQPTRERSQQPQTSEDTQATTSTETPKVVQETKGTDNEVETSAPVAEGSSTAEAPVNQQQATTAPEAGQAATLEALPIGAWPKDPKLKEVGRFQALQELKVIESYTPGLFSRVLGWSNEEIQVFMAKVKAELKDPAIHLYLPVYFVWGRKAD